MSRLHVIGKLAGERGTSIDLREHGGPSGSSRCPSCAWLASASAQQPRTAEACQGAPQKQYKVCVTKQKKPTVWHIVTAK